MAFARSHGVPVPELFDAQGPDMVLMGGAEVQAWKPSEIRRGLDPSFGTKCGRCNC